MMSVDETERLRVSAWKARAKGRTTRWRMIRDGVALLSIQWMTTSEFQIGMRRLWGLKNKTSREILEELESEGSVHQAREDKTQNFKWGATPHGVTFWIGTTKAIPAGIAEVAALTQFAAKFAANRALDRRIPGGPRAS